MILASENSTADNGMLIQSTVALRIEDVGVTERPFYVRVDVDHAQVFHAYKATEAEAMACRKRMHAAYMDAHRRVNVYA